ncbi:MAG: DUF1566 domain-containing protein, partial [Bacteroidota bacterium]|nr:DUF1566 domain-containing protein [Bacteroidota bacterium]
LLALLAAANFWIRADKAKNIAIIQKDRADSASKIAKEQTALAETSKNSLQEFLKTRIGAKHQGGIVFYWSDSTGKRGLIATEKDLEGLYSWDAAMQKFDSTTHSVTINGYNDWRLPTKEELATLYANRNLIGRFSHGIYWSSTRYGNSTSAWQQGFLNGNQNHLPMHDEYHVRLVRNFNN